VEAEVVAEEAEVAAAMLNKVELDAWWSRPAFLATSAF